MIGQRRGLLHHRKRADQLRVVRDQNAGYRKVHSGASGLRAPVDIVGDGYFAETVVFDAEPGCGGHGRFPSGEATASSARRPSVRQATAIRPPDREYGASEFYTVGHISTAVSAYSRPPRYMS